MQPRASDMQLGDVRLAVLEMTHPPHGLSWEEPGTCPEGQVTRGEEMSRCGKAPGRPSSEVFLAQTTGGDSGGSECITPRVLLG